MYLIDIYFVILLHECLPRIAFSILMNWYHRRSNFPCETSIELEVISIFHHRKPRRGIELRIFRDSNLNGLNHGFIRFLCLFIFSCFVLLLLFLSDSSANKLCIQQLCHCLNRIFVLSLIHI